MKQYFYKKKHKYNFNFFVKKKSNFNFGKITIIATQNGFLSTNEIEAARKVIRRKLLKGSKLWIIPYMNIKINSKSKGARMGKGVGKLKGYCYSIKKGTILFEILNKNILSSKEISFSLNKLSISCKIIQNKQKELKI